MGDSIRMILHTSSGAYGLTVKLDDYTAAGVELRTLLKDESGYFAFHDRVFVLNRAVGMRADHTTELFYAQYNWPDWEGEEAHPRSGICAVPSPVDAPFEEDPISFLCDMFTQRVVTVPLSFRGVRLCTVFAPRRLDG